MAVVSRIATLRLDNGLGSFRQWVATSATQDTANGSSVVVTTVSTIGGASPPTVEDSLTLNFYNDTPALIRAVTLTTGVVSQTTTFHFTDTGNSGGSSRHGTVEIALRAIKNTGAPTAQYDVETDGTPNTPPATYTATVLDRGWIRGTTTLVEAVSNVSAGGAKNSPAEYDESLFVRCTLGSASYVARALTVASSAGSLSGSTNSTTSATRDVSFTNVVDERFAAASTVVTWTVTAPNATLTGVAYTTFSTTTDDTITVDPRLNLLAPNGQNNYFFQMNKSGFATANHDASKAMGNADVGQAAARIVGSRNTGINGLSYSLTADPDNPGSTITATGTTATLDSQAGWSGLIDVCPTGKPGGPWRLACDITAPADIDDATYLLNSTDTVTVIAENPNIRMRCYLNKKDSNPRRHFTAGGAILANFFVEDLATFTKVQASRITNPRVAIRHRNPTTEKVYFLKSDTGATFADTWEEWDGASEVCTYFDMTETAIGTQGFFIKLFSNTLAWDRDISAAFVCNVDGSPYSEVAVREETGDINPHDGYAFDPIGLFK